MILACCAAELPAFPKSTATPDSDTQDERCRPCRNVGNECFINAPLQALFAVPSARRALALAASTLPPLLRTENASAIGVELAEEAAKTGGYKASDEEVLAHTFAMARFTPRNQPYHGSLLKRRFYHGIQEDSHEFFENFLELVKCPVRALFTGSMCSIM